MNNNYPTLSAFENHRKQTNFIPPYGSNSFYNIGDGQINLECIRDYNDDYRFNLSIYNGKVNGGGTFVVSGDIISPDRPYNSLTVNAGTTLVITDTLIINRGEMHVYGNLILSGDGQLVVRDNGKVTFYPDSYFNITQNSDITTSAGGYIQIYGNIDVHLSKADLVLNRYGVELDTAAVLHVTGINMPNRHYSMTNYNDDLSKKVINIHTQGERNYPNGRLGYLWTGGSPKNNSQIYQMILLWGEAVLGDFKLPVLGLPEDDIPNLQIISDILIKKKTCLYISEKYNTSHYIRPELYLGNIIGNSARSATCIVEGTIVVDGENASINIDRGSRVYIRTTGRIELKNNSKLLSTYNGEHDPILFIDGTLVIDDIEQINSFYHDNIVFGETGKLVINNPDTGTKRLLFSTPNGVESTDLYRLFKDRIKHLEYHIQNNTGIGIDAYYDSYAREFKTWFGDMRIEKCIKDGIVVWHDGGYIELYNTVTPWVNEKCTLLHAARLFKSFASYDEERLMDVANRLKYVGCGNILFRFINGRSRGELLMDLKGIRVKSILSNPSKASYKVSTDGEGTLFMRNNLNNPIAENIIHRKSSMYEIDDTELEFTI